MPHETHRGLPAEHLQPLPLARGWQSAALTRPRRFASRLRRRGDVPARPQSVPAPPSAAAIPGGETNRVGAAPGRRAGNRHAPPWTTPRHSSGCRRRTRSAHRPAAAAPTQAQSRAVARTGERAGVRHAGRPLPTTAPRRPTRCRHGSSEARAADRVAAAGSLSVPRRALAEWRVVGPSAQDAPHDRLESARARGERPIHAAAAGRTERGMPPGRAGTGACRCRPRRGGSAWPACGGRP